MESSQEISPTIDLFRKAIMRTWAPFAYAIDFLDFATRPERWGNFRRFPEQIILSGYQIQPEEIIAACIEDVIGQWEFELEGKPLVGPTKVGLRLSPEISTKNYDTLEQLGIALFFKDGGGIEESIRLLVNEDRAIAMGLKDALYQKDHFVRLTITLTRPPIDPDFRPYRITNIKFKVQPLKLIKGGTSQPVF